MRDNEARAPEEDRKRQAPEAPEGVPRVRSEVLLGLGRELIIEHGGRDYRLRVTQNGKLILTA